MAQEVNPEDVIDRLSGQIGKLYVELAMRDTALAAMQARVAELEGQQGAPPMPQSPADIPTGDAA